MGSGGGGSSQTNTQVQQIPAFEQDFSKANQNIAASLASNPYPTYSGQLIAPFTPQQQIGMGQAEQAATSYLPYLQTANTMTNQASQQWDAGQQQRYMNPYAQSALAPQIQQLQLQEGQQQNQDAARATQAGAFGDARQGVQSSLDNFYGDLALNNLEQQGMNSAYNSGLGAFQQGQQNNLATANAYLQEGSQAQGLGETGAQSNFQAGTQQQQLQQQQLTEAYNNFLNQANWGQNQLGLRESALSNSPYGNTNYLSLAPNSASAQNLGAFSALAGQTNKIFGSQGG